MACCRVGKVHGVLPMALLFLLSLSVAWAPAAPPIPGPEGQTFAFPWPPDWVAQGKYQKMVLRGVTGFNPGQWDVQACGGLPGCLMPAGPLRSEEHTSELQSQSNLVCRLLLEKKKKKKNNHINTKKKKKKKKKQKK